MIGYIALCAIFVLMVGACFAFAISEIVRPRDPGPLPIDVHRDIQHRYFARRIRRTPAPARDILAGQPTHERRFTPVMLPHGASVATTAETILVHGDGQVLPGATVASFVCDGIALIGAVASVEHHAEGGSELILDIAARVGGRATAGERILLSPGSSVCFAAAPLIRTTGGPAPSPREPLASWTGDLSADLEWLLSMGTPLDRAMRDLSAGAGGNINGVQALGASEASGPLHATEAIRLGTLAPTWLGASEAWYLGAATVRVRGDVIIPGRSIIPFHLIVEGTLATGIGVAFHGGIHAWGDVALGDGSRVEGSVTGRRDVRVGDGCWIGECVSAGGDAGVGSGSWIGSEKSGGLAAAGTVVLGPGSVICNKLYAEAGACVRELVSQAGRPAARVL